MPSGANIANKKMVSELFRIANKIKAGLLAHREMHRKMQEGIGLAQLRQIVAIERRVLVGELRMILGVLCDDISNQALERFHGLARLVLAPHGEEKAPKLRTVL